MEIKEGQFLYFVDIKNQEVDIITVIDIADEFVNFYVGQVNPLSEEKHERKTSSLRNINKFFSPTIQEAKQKAMNDSIRRFESNQRTIESLQRKNDFLKKQQDIIWNL